MTTQLLADLEWRGLIAQTTDREGLLKDLNEKPMKFYIGFDPTAPSLHVGNLVVILVMRRFQIAGHLPIALVGGATGLVGDPSGRNEERTLNDETVVLQWVENIRKQLSKFLDFESKTNAAVMANNLQAFDYLELYRRDNCKLQLGGSDQWGNIIAGLDLIRKVESGSAHAFTIPLMAKSDGSKFGKTAGGSVWLDADMTSPYAFYQFWINSDDDDVAKYLKVFSFKDRLEIERLIETVAVNPGAREAQRELARELTSLVHGSDECEKVEAASKALFGQGELKDLDEKTLSAALAQLPKVTINKGEAFPTWVDLLAATGVVESKSAARRIVKENGAYLNNEKISGEDFAPSKDNLIHGKFLVLRKGKRDLASVEVI